jgi:hypothetical protein
MPCKNLYTVKLADYYWLSFIVERTKMLINDISYDDAVAIK